MPSHAEMVTSAFELGIFAAVSGEIDLTNADQWQSWLEGLISMADGRDLVVDLSAVTFLDATGFRALVAASRTPGGQRLALREPSIPVRVVLDVLAPGHFTVL